jgi:hypothetical protein
VPPQATAERKPARPGFVAELQDRSGMGGLKLFNEFEHVVMFPADDPIPPHFARITGRYRHGNRVVMHVQTDE